MVFGNFKFLKKFVISFGELLESRCLLSSICKSDRWWQMAFVSNVMKAMKIVFVPCGIVNR